MDYGRFRYEATRKEREARKARKTKASNELRQVRFKTRIGEHDRGAKTRQVSRLLDEGSKVKVTVMFRGREMDHPEVGMRLLKLVADDLVDEALLERPPAFEGRMLSMTLSPDPAKASKATRQRKSLTVPKLKTHKGAASRFRITGTGKLVRMKGHRSHLRRKKPGNVRRLYKGTLPVSPADAPRIKRMLGK